MPYKMLDLQAACDALTTGGVVAFRLLHNTGVVIIIDAGVVLKIFLTTLDRNTVVVAKSRAKRILHPVGIHTSQDIDLLHRIKPVE